MLAISEMSGSSSSLTNPFSAARIRPGTIDFIFEHGKSLAQLVDLLESNHWRGAITGLHGTGKSTLLAAMIPAIEARSRIVKCVTLTSGQRTLPHDYIQSLRETAAQGIAAVDGIEQLSVWSRLRLNRICKVQGAGLLVASHRAARLPVIYQTAIDVPRAWRVVERFQDGFPPLVRLSDLVERLAQRHGNLREALFDLYDIYEERRRGALDSRI
jgi:hypothetical protein